MHDLLQHRIATVSGARLLAGIGAVVLVISGLGFASPSSADVNGQPTVTSEVAVNR